MIPNQMAEILNDIGITLADEQDYPLNGTLLYVEAEQAMADASVFRDMGDHVLYQDANDRIFELIHELWNAADADKKWSALEYVIKDGQFDGRFSYPEDFDPEDFVTERCSRVLRRIYGDKLIKYPPLPTDEQPAFRS